MTLTRRRFVAVRDGRATQVRYAGFAAERAALQGVLDTPLEAQAVRFMADRERIQGGRDDIVFLGDDWALNDVH
jgi:hypothetical protein